MKACRFALLPRSLNSAAEDILRSNFCTSFRSTPVADARAANEVVCIELSRASQKLRMHLSAPTANADTSASVAALANLATIPAKGGQGTQLARQLFRSARTSRGTCSAGNATARCCGCTATTASSGASAGGNAASPRASASAARRNLSAAARRPDPVLRPPHLPPPPRPPPLASPASIWTSCPDVNGLELSQGKSCGHVKIMFLIHLRCKITSCWLRAVAESTDYICYHHQGTLYR